MSIELLRALIAIGLVALLAVCIALVAEGASLVRRLTTRTAPSKLSRRRPSWEVMRDRHGPECPCRLCDETRRREAAITILVVYAEALIREATRV